MNHFHPLLPVWSIYFIIFPNEIAPLLILATQSALLSLPILGLYRHYGPIPAFAYALYFPVWYNALFDFHMDHMAVPILFAFFFFVKQGKFYHAVAMAVLLAFVKEVFALQTAFCGIYLLTAYKKKAGLGLILFGGLYFYLGLEFIQNYFMSYAHIITGGTSAFTSINSPYSWLGSNLKEVFLSILYKPHLIIWDIITNKEKVVYICYLFGALGFISFLKPKIILVAIPSLAMSLLSSHPSHFGYTHHYTAGLIAPLIIGFAEGLSKAEAIWNYLEFNKKFFTPLVVAGLVSSHVFLSPSPIGRKFFLEKAWNYHYSIYLPSERSKMVKTAIKKFIPSDPNIIVSTQNSLNWLHLTKRRHLFIFPEGATEKKILLDSSHISLEGFSSYIYAEDNEKYPTPTKAWADYVALDLRRPWFIIDQGCQWIAGACQDGETLRQPDAKTTSSKSLDFPTQFINLVNTTKKNFKIIYENDGFLILKRKSDSQLIQ
jgi:uncharacterized membrane protein